MPTHQSTRRAAFIEVYRHDSICFVGVMTSSSKVKTRSGVEKSAMSGLITPSGQIFGLAPSFIEEAAWRVPKIIMPSAIAGEGDAERPHRFCRSLAHVDNIIYRL